MPCPGRSKLGVRVKYAIKKPELPFPAGSVGFLYYDHVDPDHPVCGQLRFRVTGSRDPATFRDGHDLLDPNGLVWAIPLPSIASASQYTALAGLLVAEGLVTQEVMVTLAKLNYKMVEPTRLLLPSRRTFVGQLSAYGWRLLVARGATLHKLILTNPLVDMSWVRKSPYNGI